MNLEYGYVVRLPVPSIALDGLGIEADRETVANFNYALLGGLNEIMGNVRIDPEKLGENTPWAAEPINSMYTSSVKQDDAMGEVAYNIKLYAVNSIDSQIKIRKALEHIKTICGEFQAFYEPAQNTSKTRY